MSFVLVHGRTRAIVAREVELADTRAARTRGLLGRHRLDPESAIFLTPCLAIHTAFMRFPIDVVFIDGDGRAVHLAHELRPWRVAASPRARSVIEMAAGRVEACGIEIGDLLHLEPERW